MSRNSKTATRLIAAREMSSLHKNGGKGPAKTVAKHGKDALKRHYSVTSRVPPQTKAAQR